jgi:hypothetical protein
MVWYAVAGAACLVGAAWYYAKGYIGPAGSFHHLPTLEIIKYIETSESHKGAKKLLWTASASEATAAKEVDPVVDDILATEGINATSPHFSSARAAVHAAALNIKHLSNLIASLEARRVTAYDRANADHERELLRLWSVMVPETPLPSRVSSAWERLGFQGFDPATDFRGGGVLGLDCLLAFAEQYPKLSHAIATKAHDEGVQWFSYAITGINVAFEALKLARGSPAFFMRYGFTHEAFVDLFALVFSTLHRRWLTDRPPNVMSFGQYFAVTLDEVRAAVTGSADGEFARPVDAAPEAEAA